MGSGYGLSRKDGLGWQGVQGVVGFFCEGAMGMCGALLFGWMRSQLRVYGSGLAARQHW